MKLTEIRQRVVLPVLQEGKKDKGGKIKRDTFVYLSYEDDSYGDPHCFAQCETCRLWTGEEHKTCMIFGKDSKAVGHGSCDLYVNGKPHPEWHGHEEKRVTPEQAGYVERQVRCENCVAFKPQGDDGSGKCKFYKKLNKSNPDLFDLDENISATCCCNAQTAK